MAVLSHPHLQDGRPQDVACILETNTYPIVYIDNLVTLDRIEVLEAVPGVIHGVERPDLLVGLALVPLALPLGLHLLHVGRVQKHDLTELGRRIRSDDPALETIPHQLW